MVNIYDDNGCWVGSNAYGKFVTYEDYRELEIADDIFQKKVHQVLKDLTALPELDVAGGGSNAARDLDDAINDAIVQIENAFSERTD
jgi:hypothetical protein